MHDDLKAHRLKVYCDLHKGYHSEYFLVAENKACRAVARWRKWFDTEPYDIHGRLSPFWVARLKEARILFTKRFSEGMVLDPEAVLDFITRPMTDAQRMAFHVRKFFFLPSTGRCSWFQILMAFIQESLTSNYPTILLVLGIVWIFFYFRILYISLCSSLLGIFLFWARHENEADTFQIKRTKQPHPHECSTVSNGYSDIQTVFDSLLKEPELETSEKRNALLDFAISPFVTWILSKRRV